MNPRMILRLLGVSTLPLAAQQPGPPPGFADRPGGPPVQEERKLVAQFDRDGDQRLDKTERAAAREFLKANPTPRGFGGPRRGGFPGGPPRADGPGRPPGAEEDATSVQPGPRVSPADVEPSPVRDLYSPEALRTLFLDFENDDWEAELEAFHGTDVEVPATLTVDGKTYPGVGIHFRGMSSYMMVSAGRKRSLNLSLDFTDKKQRLDGYKTLNLLNSHEDGTLMTPVIYSQIARKYLAAPKANFVRLVINGESWGIYVNQQQFDKDFLQENFRTPKGARWKVRGSPMGRGGLDDAGDDLAAYRQRYEMKQGDEADWQALVKLCKTLSHTPPEQLEAALEPQLDLDSVLWFLALDCGLINGDGYWIRASDYSLYRDPAGRFHLIPADMNEAFRPAGGGPGFGPPGMRRSIDRPAAGREGEDQGATPAEGSPPPPQAPGAPSLPPGLRTEGVKLDPLVGLDDAQKPLRSKLLAVPALRARYLAKVRLLATESLDWQKLGPQVAAYRQQIAAEVKADTRKLSSWEEFDRLTADQPSAAAEESDEPARGRFGPPPQMPLRTFADQRRAFLLALPEQPKASEAPPEAGEGR